MGKETPNPNKFYTFFYFPTCRANPGLYDSLNSIVNFPICYQCLLLVTFKQQMFAFNNVQTTNVCIAMLTVYINQTNDICKIF